MVDTKKVIYFILAILTLILLEVLIVNHMDNKILVRGIKNEEKKEDLKTYNDEKTGIILKYELSNEILKDDILLIREKELTKKLKKKDVIEYFSISLYDKDNIKKRIKNSKLTVYYPINENIEKYNRIKVIRLNAKVEITNDEIKHQIKEGFLVFDITMTSKYGIIGIKK